MVECGLTNLAVCIPEKFFEYAVSIFNAPLQILLDLTKNLLIEPVNISLFQNVWVIIIYIISIFYGLFFMGAGFNFIISGYDSAKREKAKLWFRNIVLMIIFIQASYIIYGVVNDLASSLSAGVFGLIDPSFFLFSTDDFAGIGLELILLFPYIFILIISIILLGLRYLMIAFGVIIFPIGIFFYFIPLLNAYGKLILNVLLVAMFLPFFQVLILLAGSMLSEAGIFENFSIIVSTISFAALNIITLFLLFFAVVKAAFSLINSDVGRAVKYLI